MKVTHRRFVLNDKNTHDSVTLTCWVPALNWTTPQPLLVTWCGSGGQAAREPKMRGWFFWIAPLKEPEDYS